MAAANEAGEREIVPDAVLSGFNALVDEVLDSVPCVAADKRFMPAFIRHSVPIEIAGIDPLSQDLVQGARSDAASPDGPSLRFALCGKRLQRILPRHEFIKQPRDDRRVVVGNDQPCTQGVWSVRRMKKQPSGIHPTLLPW